MTSPVATWDGSYRKRARVRLLLYALHTSPLHQKGRRAVFGYDLKSSQDFDGTISISKFSKFKYSEG